MKSCFISHSTKDEIGEAFSKYLVNLGIPANKIFCSSDPAKGVDASAQWFDEIFRKIRKSDIVFVIASPNYLRSGISLLEAGAALGAKKTLIILAFPNVNFSELSNIFHGHQIIDFAKANAKTSFERALIDHLIKKKSLTNIINNDFKNILEIMSKHTSAEINTSPISIKEDYENILKPALENGINRLTLESIDMAEKLKIAKRIRIISTTGIGFCRTYIDQQRKALEIALQNGCQIDFLLGNPSSQFFNDVEIIEGRQKGELDNEFNQVVNMLLGIIKKGNVKSGKIYIGNVGTALRQTAVLLSDSIDGPATWGWNTITLPPSKSNARSMSIELTNKRGGTMLRACENYFNEIYKKAKREGELFELTPNNIKECFKYEGDFALRKWNKLQEDAIKAMKKIETEVAEKSLLIECAAQHPLLTNGQPGPEFKSRLDRAISIYNSYRKNGWKVKIYVPGSLHQTKNIHGDYVIDLMTLAQSGENYLKENNIPKEDILADECNKEYKKDEGVYNSADECYVASCIFIKQKFKRLFCICSPSQLTRKYLFYLLFHISPIMISASPEDCGFETFHRYPYEAIISVPELIRSMDNLQNPESLQAKQSRIERNPFYNKK